MRTLLKQGVAAGMLAAATLSVASTADAVEGAVQYPHGAEGFYAGALPPPGTYLLAYTLYYDGDLQDGGSKDVKTPAGDRINLKARAFAPRLVHMTDWEIFGAQYGVHAIVPFFSNTLTIGNQHDTNTGLGDITINPAILAWHREDLHWAVGLDVNIPTGKYDVNRPLGNNIGANYWSLEPLLAVTWFPGDGWELNGKFMYNYKFENPDTDYHSGDEFHMDYTVAKTFLNDWTVGVGGYYVKQLSDDTQNGVKQDNRSHVFSIGPQVKYQLGATSLIAKWQHEMFSENTFEGNRFLFKVVHAF